MLITQQHTLAGHGLGDGGNLDCDEELDEEAPEEQKQPTLRTQAALGAVTSGLKCVHSDDRTLGCWFFSGPCVCLEAVLTIRLLNF